MAIENPCHDFHSAQRHARLGPPARDRATVP
jgi:hypothetical protein